MPDRWQITIKLPSEQNRSAIVFFTFLKFFLALSKTSFKILYCIDVAITLQLKQRLKMYFYNSWVQALVTMNLKQFLVFDPEILSLEILIKVCLCSMITIILVTANAITKKFEHFIKYVETV